MRSKQFLVFVLFAVTAAVYLGSGFFNNWSEQREKTRLENMLAPVIAKSVEGSPDPKPTLYFVVATEKSLQVVLKWEQKPEAAIKNDMRDRVSLSVRREVSADPKSWGRYVSVVFDDEVVTQGWK